MKPTGRALPRRRRHSLRKDIERGKYILNPDFNQTEAEREEQRNAIMNHCVLMQKLGKAPFGSAIKEFSSYFPEDYGKELSEAGAWILVHEPPVAEYTVPPFSIWFAVLWPMDKGELCDRLPQRVKIQTPMGDLGLFPHEYALIGDIKSYVGREATGVYFRQMNGAAVFPAEQLFYLQSRGIRRADACMMLLDQMSDPTFGWFEIAPPYGAYFGQEWPVPERCPFATPLHLWHEEKA